MNYKDRIKEFELYLIREEKAKNTIEKYMRDIRIFYEWFEEKMRYEDVTKDVLIEYKTYLRNSIEKTSTINSKISSLNAFFTWAESELLKIKVFKCQKSLFGQEEKNLSIEDVKRLINVSESERDKLIIETIVKTGIRVSEISSITVLAIKVNKAIVNNKGKERIVIIPYDLCNKLKLFCKKNKIENGPVFISKNGNPIDRKQVWKLMKNLCKESGVNSKKVFPHNLRHLFAREYYKENKNIVKLASILGHSSIETTRIYTMETEMECRISIEKLKFIHLIE